VHDSRESRRIHQVKQKVAITWVQIGADQDVPIHSQSLARKIPGNFRLGDQFLALQKGRKQSSDDGRHFGLVVADKDAVRRALAEAGVEMLPGPFLDFRDPWGNRIEIVGYDNVQFSKAPNGLRGMGLAHLAKNAKAIKELAEKGMAPD
jgi:hypothetical protein